MKQSQFEFMDVLVREEENLGEFKTFSTIAGLGLTMYSAYKGAEAVSYLIAELYHGLNNALF